jgi:hypothetical protein
MGSDTGKSRAGRIREIWPICAHDASLWVRMRRQIVRARADFAQFSEMSDNRETGWWSRRDLNRRPLRFTLMLNSTSTATRLNGGKVLESSGYLASAELYVGLVSKTQTSSAVLGDR